MAALLLEKGAAVDAADNQGRQPLHMAAAGGRVELMKLLLKASASSAHQLDARASDGATAISLAAYWSRADAVEVQLLRLLLLLLILVLLQLLHLLLLVRLLLLLMLTSLLPQYLMGEGADIEQADNFGRKVRLTLLLALLALLLALLALLLLTPPCSPWTWRYTPPQPRAPRSSTAAPPSAARRDGRDGKRRGRARSREEQGQNKAIL